MVTGFLGGKEYPTRFRFYSNVSEDRPLDTTDFSKVTYSKIFVKHYMHHLKDEKPIERIAVYEESIKGIPLVKHAFVVIETENAAFCIDRHDTETYLRKAKDAESLITVGPGGPRDYKRVTKVEKGKGTIAEVVQMMYDEGLSSKSYNLATNNCQTTAWAVFNSFHETAKVVTQKATGLVDSFRRISRLVNVSF